MSSVGSGAARKLFRKRGFGLLFDREPVVVVSVAFGVVGLSLPILVPPLRRSMNLSTSQYDGTNSFYDARYTEESGRGAYEQVKSADMEKRMDPVVRVNPKAVARDAEARPPSKPEVFGGGAHGAGAWRKTVGAMPTKLEDDDDDDE